MRQERLLWPRLLTVLGTGLVLIYVCFLFAPGAGRGPVAYAAGRGEAVPIRAFVIGSEPVDGATIADVPKVVRIFFNEDISAASFAHVYVFDTSVGRLVDGGRSVVAKTNARELDTPLANPVQLPQGIYEVKWVAVASNDGQVTSGLIGFNVGHGLGLQGDTILGPTSSNNPVTVDFIGILSIAWEWLVLAALTFWIGILVVEGFFASLRMTGNARMTGDARMAGSAMTGGDAGTGGNDLLTRVRTQSIPLQWLCLSAFLAGEVVIVLLRSITFSNTVGGNGGINLNALGQILFSTSYGMLWFVRIVLVVVALGLLRWSFRARGKARKAARLPRNKRFSQLRQQVMQEQQTEEEQQGAVAGTTAREPVSGKDTHGYTIISLVLAGILLLTFALSSDTTQLAQPHISAVVLDWLYLASRSVWLGSLTYLGYVLLPQLPTIEQDRQASVLSAVLQRFHPLLLGTVGVLLVSGLYLSESSIFDATQLTGDPYGRALLVLVVLVGLMLLLSAFIIFVLRPKLARQAALLPVIDAELPTRRTRQSALEQTVRGIKGVAMALSWLGAGVLLCAALMAFFAPPIVFPNIDYATAANSSVAPPPGINAQTEQVGDLSVTLQVSPGRSGYANTVILTINDSAGNPVTDAQVQLSTNMVIMDMGNAHATINGGNPTYIATFNKNAAFSMDGLWDITVRIQRPGQAAMQTIFQVTLNS